MSDTLTKQQFQTMLTKAFDTGYRAHYNTVGMSYKQQDAYHKRATGKELAQAFCPEGAGYCNGHTRALRNAYIAGNFQANRDAHDGRTAEAANG